MWCRKLCSSEWYECLSNVPVKFIMSNWCYQWHELLYCWIVFASGNIIVYRMCIG